MQFSSYPALQTFKLEIINGNWKLTFVSSLFPSPLAPKSSTLKVAEPLVGELDGGASSFGGGEGGGGNGALCDGIFGFVFGFDPPLWLWWLLP